MVEVSVTRVWQGTQVQAEPDTHWSIQFYGLHWDEAVNHIRAGDRAKDWGEGLRNVWTGAAEASLETRFREFLKEVLALQATLGTTPPPYTVPPSDATRALAQDLKLEPEKLGKAIADMPSPHLRSPVSSRSDES